MARIQVKLQNIYNSGPKQQAIATEACRLLEVALNHDSFKEIVLNTDYEKSKFQDHNRILHDKTPEEIYKFISGGLEYGTDQDQEIDIIVSLAPIKKGVLGSTTPRQLPFQTSYWFINDCIRYNDPISLASHFIHEWLHVAGFIHYPDNSARNDVPYHIGSIVKNILLKSDAPTPFNSLKVFSFNPTEEITLESALAPVLEHSSCGCVDISTIVDVATL